MIRALPTGLLGRAESPTEIGSNTNGHIRWLQRAFGLFGGL